MTKKIFWQNPYLTELETTILTVNEDQVTVAETIFYAFSGGQESDYGFIGGHKVIEAKKMGKEIIYVLQLDHGLNVGDKIKMVIDWERRYKLMRLHFAAEIILELIYKQFPYIAKIGAHISPEKARIDFKWEENLTPFLSAIQEEAQMIIDSNQEIMTDFSDVETERRYWKINNFPPISCGGTHVKLTAEIGVLYLKRVNPGKGKERIEIFAKQQAIE